MTLLAHKFLSHLANTVTAIVMVCLLFPLGLISGLVQSIPMAVTIIPMLPICLMLSLLIPIACISMIGYGGVQLVMFGMRMVQKMFSAEGRWGQEKLESFTQELDLNVDTSPANTPAVSRSSSLSSTSTLCEPNATPFRDFHFKDGFNAGSDGEGLQFTTKKFALV